MAKRISHAARASSKCISSCHADLFIALTESLPVYATLKGPMPTLAASVVSTLTSQPGDTILSEINKAGAENSCIFRVVRNLGCPTELFRGVKARLVHLLALVSSQLLIYDYIKVMVGLSATGT